MVSLFPMRSGVDLDLGCCGEGLCPTDCQSGLARAGRPKNVGAGGNWIGSFVLGDGNRGGVEEYDRD